MKLINSFHGATCLVHLLITKVSLNKQKSVELWFNYDQSEIKSPRETIKNSLDSNHEAKLDSAASEISSSFIEPGGNSAANRPHAWCPRYRRPDDEASDDVKVGLVDRAVSIETSLTRSIHHQQNCQHTENAPVAVEARWKANPHHQGCLEVAVNRDEDVAFINYDSLNENRQN